MSAKQSQKNFKKQTIKSSSKTNADNVVEIDDLFEEYENNKQQQDNKTINKARKPTGTHEEDDSEIVHNSPIKKLKLEQLEPKISMQKPKLGQVSKTSDWLLKLQQTLNKSADHPQLIKKESSDKPASQETKECDMQFLSLIREIIGGNMKGTKMYLQAFESSENRKYPDGYMPYDIVKEDDRQCDAIQCQIMIGKQDDDQFPLCFSSGQGSKYKYARFRFCQNGKLQFFHPKLWRYFQTASTIKFDIRDVLLRLFEAFDESNLTIDNPSDTDKWDQAVQILEMLKNSKIGSESTPFELMH